MELEPENVKAALEEVASNPKIAAAVSAATSGMGVAATVSDIQTALGVLSLLIGCLIGIYVIRINAIRRKIYQRMLDNGESLKE